jgi:hypothetical protein
MWHGWGRIQMGVGLWSAKLKESENLEYLGVDGRIILQYILKK